MKKIKNQWIILALLVAAIVGLPQLLSTSVYKSMFITTNAPLGYESFSSEKTFHFTGTTTEDQGIVEVQFYMLDADFEGKMEFWNYDTNSWETRCQQTSIGSGNCRFLHDPSASWLAFQQKSCEKYVKVSCDEYWESGECYMYKYEVSMRLTPNRDSQFSYERVRMMGFTAGTSDMTCFDDLTEPNEPTIYCGDGQCQPLEGENCHTCSADCPCSTGTCQLTGGEWMCVSDPTAVCGDGYCDPIQEDWWGCPADCPFVAVCGDGLCSTELGEHMRNCPADCSKYCGDGTCSPVYGEDSEICPEDCGSEEPPADEWITCWKCVGNTAMQRMDCFTCGEGVCTDYQFLDKPQCTLLPLGSECTSDDQCQSEICDYTYAAYEYPANEKKVCVLERVNIIPDSCVLDSDCPEGMVCNDAGVCELSGEGVCPIPYLQDPNNNCALTDEAYLILGAIIFIAFLIILKKRMGGGGGGYDPFSV